MGFLIFLSIKFSRESASTEEAQHQGLCQFVLQLTTAEFAQDMQGASGQLNPIPKRCAPVPNQARKKWRSKALSVKGDWVVFDLMPD